MINSKHSTLGFQCHIVGRDQVALISLTNFGSEDPEHYDHDVDQEDDHFKLTELPEISLLIILDIVLVPPHVVFLARAHGVWVVPVLGENGDDKNMVAY